MISISICDDDMVCGVVVIISVMGSVCGAWACAAAAILDMLRTIE